MFGSPRHKQRWMILQVEGVRVDVGSLSLSVCVCVCVCVCAWKCVVLPWLAVALRPGLAGALARAEPRPAGAGAAWGCSSCP